MKRNLIAALLAASFAAPAFAGDTATLAVTASVSGTCKFTTGTFNMNFGALDPASVSNQTQNTAVTYKCTKDTAPTSFSFDGATASPTSVNITNGTDNIPVSLSWTVPATLGSGFGAGSTAISMNVAGDILGTSYANVSAGAYSKNVAVIVAP
jgi:spore coat protein U-like protein